jgi:hypothetical protein
LLLKGSLWGITELWSFLISEMNVSAMGNNRSVQATGDSIDSSRDTNPPPIARPIDSIGDGTCIEGCSSNAVAVASSSSSSSSSTRASEEIVGALCSSLYIVTSVSDSVSRLKRKISVWNGLYNSIIFQADKDLPTYRGTVCFDPTSGKLAISGNGMNGDEIHIWSIHTNAKLATVMHAEFTEFTTLMFNSSGTHLVVTTHELVMIFVADTGEKKATSVVGARRYASFGFEDTIVLCLDDHCIEAWNVDSSHLNQRFEGDFADKLVSCPYRPLCVAFAEEERAILVWDYADNKALFNERWSHRGIPSICFGSGESDVLFMGGAEILVCWNYSSKEVIFEITLQRIALGTIIFDHGNRLLIAYNMTRSCFIVFGDNGDTIIEHGLLDKNPVVFCCAYPLSILL